MGKLQQYYLTASVLLGVASAAQAYCPQDGATPMKIGPYSPQTTFPLWVQDSVGLPLEICPGTDQVNCISVPPFTAADFPGDPDAATKAALSQQIGFGDEGFWASADALIDIPASGALATAGRAILVSGVEAAFLPDFADGNQFPFTRLRLRIDVPQAGTYVVTHPWGQITYNITTPGIKAINDSFDIPFSAGQQDYVGRIGPILTWDTFPNDPILDTDGDGVADYIGTLNYVNPQTNGPEHRVTGSPCGNNVFRIEGPDIGGPGVNSIETDLFTVTGKLYNAQALPVPLEIDQLTYSRSPLPNTSVGMVSVFASAPAKANVSFSGGGNLPAGAHAMNHDGSGRFFGSVRLLPDASALPATVAVTANNQNIAPASQPITLDVPLVDLVTITRAEYDVTTGILTVDAHSSDEISPPVLTVLGQNLVAGSIAIPLSVAPANVTVTSAAGGAATIPVTIVHSAP